jgi:hypothetical protein
MMKEINQVLFDVKMDKIDSLSSTMPERRLSDGVDVATIHLTKSTP